MYKSKLEINGAGFVAFSWADIPAMTSCIMECVGNDGGQAHADEVMERLHTLNFHPLADERWVEEAQEDINDRVMEQAIRDTIAIAKERYVSHISFMCGPLIIVLTTQFLGEDKVEESNIPEDELLALSRKEREMVMAKYDLEYSVTGYYRPISGETPMPLIMDRQVSTKPVDTVTRTGVAQWNGLTSKILDLRPLGFSASSAGVSSKAADLYSKVCRELDDQTIASLSEGNLEGEVTIEDEMEMGKMVIYLKASIKWSQAKELKQD